MQVKLIFTWKVVHLASLWKRGTQDNSEMAYWTKPGLYGRYIDDYIGATSSSKEDLLRSSLIIL